MWSLLLITLPTQPNAVRVRVWRALKAQGCAALRDGAYILPAAHSAIFETLAAEVLEHGGAAQVLKLEPHNEAQRAELLALFDRSQAYAEWQAEATALHAALSAQATQAARPTPTGLTETEARRSLRAVTDALHTLQHTDYYPGPAHAQATAALAALRQTLDAQFSRGEPQAQPDASLVLLDRRKFQGKQWATRARPWVDRLACAWLIRRFIDSAPQFIWLPGEAPSLPRGAIGYDMDGARFTHVGARVSFEVLLASFGLAANTALQRVARSVHYLDAGGIPTPEAAGLEAVLAGLRELHTDDATLQRAADSIWDALYAAPATGSGGPAGPPPLLTPAATAANAAAPAKTKINKRPKP